MTAPLADTCCARLPRESLPWLAPLRACPELLVLLRGDETWVWWPAGDAELARTLLALDGAELFAWREGQWFRTGCRLPCFDVPSPDEARPLSAVLSPAPVDAVPPPDATGPVRLAGPTLRLLPCDQPRPCTLLRVVLADLARWADHASSHQIGALVASRDLDRVLLRTADTAVPLPLLPGERFWGQRVFLPVGCRAEPDLPEDVLATVLRLDADDMAILTDEGAEIIPLSGFAPLTRAGVRLLGREAPA
jgi:hypothetical protein